MLALQLLQLLVPLHIAATTRTVAPLHATTATAAPTAECQAVADLWCNAGNDCVAVCRKAGDELPLVARHDIIAGGGGWKCFSPSALDPTKRKYVETHV